MATILALVSSLAWGSADFLGGQVSKRYPAFFEYRGRSYRLRLEPLKSATES